MKRLCHGRDTSACHGRRVSRRGGHFAAAPGPCSRTRILRPGRGIRLRADLRPLGRGALKVTVSGSLHRPRQCRGGGGGVSGCCPQPNRPITGLCWPILGPFLRQPIARKSQKQWLKSGFEGRPRWCPSPDSPFSQSSAPSPRASVAGHMFDNRSPTDSEPLVRGQHRRQVPPAARAVQRERRGLGAAPFCAVRHGFAGAGPAIDGSIWRGFAKSRKTRRSGKGRAATRTARVRDQSSERRSSLWSRVFSPPLHATESVRTMPAYPYHPSLSTLNTHKNHHLISLSTRKLSSHIAARSNTTLS